jgi:hypothetical protein
MNLVFSTTNRLKRPSILIENEATKAVSIESYNGEITHNRELPFPEESISQFITPSMPVISTSWNMLGRAVPTSSCNGCGNRKPVNPFRK